MYLVFTLCCWQGLTVSTHLNLAFMKYDDLQLLLSTRGSKVNYDLITLRISTDQHHREPAELTLCDGSDDVYQPSFL
ncbi:uncharacterized protein B0J16DRAFT_334268 [Fusarium flagelliforme]|uniref:uncharacterized protein n=1 Tax=Fusarium flagelliforme TaxID=2675880 RepID=UPI001E8D1553|nr:uncharacterized protein B0J16DRAFT_334268 [Fusarium flagelliforme]KAH7193050.1 hypothetical protein B0J16DRAFT_334268 [Fusarium flagelliforme]